ncbi:MAG: thioredoxin family protein [Saprospiraceae bacterium]|nr:thioredoxin family protein [Saprospiraceae bacterium]
MNESFTYPTINEVDFNELLKDSEGRPFLVVFTADWLGEGTIMDSIIEGLSNEYQDRMGFYRIDIEECKNVSHQMGIRRLPAIYLFQNGEIFDHFSGMVPARTIEQHITSML